MELMIKPSTLETDGGPNSREETMYKTGGLSSTITYRKNILQMARTEIDSRVINDYLLSRGRDAFEPTPKHLRVTKRLYKPYDKLFAQETPLSPFSQKSRQHQASRSVVNTARSNLLQKN